MKDLQTGTIARVLAAPNGSSSDQLRVSALSADARYVAFYSEGGAFVKDLYTGAITRVSTAVDGTQANSMSFPPAISADGRYVAFGSVATNLVPEDTNGFADIFVKDLQTGIIARASTTAGGTQGNNSSHRSFLAADGRYVAFESDATNLVPGDTNGGSDVFVKDLQTDAITRVSTSADGTQGNSFSDDPLISADGRYIAFSSEATNLVPGDTNGGSDVFVKNPQTGAIARVSTAVDGTQGNLSSHVQSISADGRYIAFKSQATNLVPGDTNKKIDIFVKDLQTGAITRVSTAADGTQGNQSSEAGSLSGDGRYVAFDSDATNLVPGDTNGKHDVFVAQVGLWGIGGVDSVSSSVTYGLGPQLENLTLTGTEAITGLGNELANVIFGNAAANPLMGNHGDDTLAGGAGDDYLDGGPGFDAAVLSGAVANYRFTDRGVSVAVSGPDGSDSLWDIEQLRFGNLYFSIADRSHFNPLFYLNQNPDVAAAAIDPLTHYRSAGWAEGRDPNPNVGLATVNGLEYIASYGDLMAALGLNKAAGYQHFATVGLFEGRTISFDGLEYIASYGDLMNAFGANADGGATHYIGAGHTEGRHVTFDGLQYIASYGDLINAFHAQVAVDPDPDIGASHYIQSGYAERRAPDRFDAAQYLANYADLQTAFGTDLEAATLHYITQGYFEGRTDHHHVVGTSGHDILNATRGDDLIEGLAGDDTLYGLAGDDTLDSGPGYDTMYGGAGNDTYISGPTGFATVVEASIARISTANDGTQGNDASHAPSLSADGRYVAFDSGSTNLVPGDANGFDDVFVKDLQSGGTRLVSTAADGTQANADSWNVSLSADGRHVLFGSWALNLGTGPLMTDGPYGFVKDLQTGALSHLRAGNYTSISADGSFVASTHSDLWLDENGHPDVFVHYKQPTGWTGLSYVSSIGNARSSGGSLSADARYVAFESEATNLVAGDTNVCQDIFVLDRYSWKLEIKRASTAADGTQGNGFSDHPSISADGRYVAFESVASNLVPSHNTVPGFDVFVKDLKTGAITLASTAADGTQANGSSHEPSLSADGRYVAFYSLSTNLVPGEDTNGRSDVFVKDLQTGAIARVSTAADGTQANGDSWYASLCADGRYVAFESKASNLVAGDTNDQSDVFVAQVAFGGAGGIDTIFAPTRVLGPQIENLTLTGTAAGIGEGNELDNVIIGNVAANSLWGGAATTPWRAAVGTTKSMALWGSTRRFSAVRWRIFASPKAARR